ncbi:hypothetical protein ACFX12_018159 [Malus domestica]
MRTRRRKSGGADANPNKNPETEVEDRVPDASGSRCGQKSAASEDEGTMELVQIGAERTKNVLILMSDTGGGHCASAEAICDAFRMEFGDKYMIFVKDVWKEYTGWLLKDMERSYKFMVKHVQLWKVAFHSTSPQWIHRVYLAAIAAYYAKFRRRSHKAA